MGRVSSKLPPCGMSPPKEYNNLTRCTSAYIWLTLLSMFIPFTHVNTFQDEIRRSTPRRPLSVEASQRSQPPASQSQPPASPPLPPHASLVHKCLIYLGDINRYHATVRLSEPRPPYLPTPPYRMPQACHWTSDPVVGDEPHAIPDWISMQCPWPLL